MTDHTRALERLLPAVRQGAQLALQVGRDLDDSLVDDKSETRGEDPVTVGDWGCQAIICRALAEAFPDDVIVGEEDLEVLGAAENAGTLQTVARYVGHHVPGASATQVADWIARGAQREASGRYWTLDPIDGTKGFVRGDHFAVALALVVDGVVEVSLLGCPRLSGSTDRAGGRGDGVILHAIRGQGAFCTPLNGAGTTPFSVSDISDVTRGQYCESVEAWSDAKTHARIAEKLGMTAPPVKLDSQVKYASVARGDVEICFRFQTRADYKEKIWDHAAGYGCVTEAGGRVTDFAGRDLDFSTPPYLETTARGILITNGKVHDRVLAAINDL